MRTAQKKFLAYHFDSSVILKLLTHLIIITRLFIRNTAISMNSNSFSVTNKLALGAGCYWGTEKFVIKDFQNLFPNSIKKAKVGFMAPDPESALKNPTYRQVCSGTSGHIEVLDLELSDAKYFEDLVKFFFQFHDPTTKNRQGNDVGYQYASCIFVSNEEQESIALKVKQDVQKLVDQKRILSYASAKVETLITSYNQFYEAQEDHQEYLMKNPNGYCNHRIRFKDWPSADSVN